MVFFNFIFNLILFFEQNNNNINENIYYNANQIPFHKLCDQFEKVSKESKRDKKLNLIFTKELADKINVLNIY